MNLLPQTLNLNDLKIFIKGKNETIAIGEIVKFDVKVGKEEWAATIDINLLRKDITNYFKGGYPLSFLKGLKFIQLKQITNNQSEIVDSIEPAGFVDCLIKKNRFKKATKHLYKLGITQQLIDDIPVGYAYYGMREICSCNIEDCYHSNVLILKYEDYFVIPFMLSLAMPYYFFDFNIRTTYPEEEYNLNECDEDEWENIFDEEMNYLGKKEPEFLSTHIAKRKDFVVEKTNLYKMNS